MSISIFYSSISEIIERNTSIKNALDSFKQNKMNGDEFDSILKMSLERITQRIKSFLIFLDGELANPTFSITNENICKIQDTSNILTKQLNSFMKGFENFKSSKNIHNLEQQFISYKRKLDGFINQFLLIANELKSIEFKSKCVRCINDQRESLKKFQDKRNEIRLQILNKILDSKGIELKKIGPNLISQNSILKQFILSLKELPFRNLYLKLYRTNFSDSDRKFGTPSIPPGIEKVCNCKSCEFLDKFGQELNDLIIKLFKEGKWLEVYTNEMVNLIPLGTSFLNVELIKNDISIEIDVLLIYNNELIIFECKDIFFSENFENTKNELEEWVKKVSALDLRKVCFIFNVVDGKQDEIENFLNEKIIIELENPKIIFIKQSKTDNLYEELLKHFPGD